MKAVICDRLADRFGDFTPLQLQHSPSPPTLGPSDVRVAIHAVALNYPDLLMVHGGYQFKPPPPYTPGMEAAGCVVAAGPRAGVKVGEFVCVSGRCGLLAEEVVVPAMQVHPMPRGLNVVQAAGFPMGTQTAYHALVERGGLQAGEWVVVHGSTGGMGVAAVQLAKALGAHVIATGTDPVKLAELQATCAVEHVVTLSKTDGKVGVDEIRALTADRGGADVIYDPVGGDALLGSFRYTRPFKGRILLVGFASGVRPQLPANIALIKGLTILGCRAGEFARHDPALLAPRNAVLQRLVDEGRLTPYVGLTVPLERFRDAFDALAERRAAGKIVITTKHCREVSKL